ncbi:GTPase domain-containing protein [Micromonospora sp. NPDC049559]|uniref:GTPase domain-containing protein n=1 Tax=Micromonospora sp. NPDC049559 TaxID=3155923 RepID=UPI003441C07B
MGSLWDEARDTWDRAVSSVDQHRDWSRPSLRARRLWLRRANVPIVVTGRPGAGKTALFEALTDRVSGLGYTTRVSADWERHRVLLRGEATSVRAAFLVVPGQDSPERTRSVARTFKNRAAPVGVIHVVCSGFNELWSGPADGALRDLDPAPTREGNERVRRYLLDLEVQDFAELGQLLREPAVRRRLRWLIIAVAKIDLVWDELGEVRDHYIPGGVSSPFHRVLDGLRSGERSLPPRIAIVPFSGHPEAHQYAPGLYRTPSRLDGNQATALRDNFYDVLGRML